MSGSFRAPTGTRDLLPPASARAREVVTRFAETKPSKARFSGTVLARLAFITVIAFGCALLFRPAGIAVFAGLAVFQLLAVASSMVPLIKEIRKR